jgi:SAM-dependent methyltransferase
MKSSQFCQAEPDIGSSLNQWFWQLPGRYLQEQEMAQLELLLPELFGYYLLQCGMTASSDQIAQASKMRSHLILNGSRQFMDGALSIQADPMHIPVATDSIDAVLLFHTLDFAADPHQVLREVERVLIPEGRLLIMGFNPWSLWGVWRLFGRRRGRVPWCGQFISQRRLHDWLSLLGFELEQAVPLMFRPPLQNATVMGKLEFMEQLGERFWPFLAGAYLIQAVRRVSTLTPIRTGWRERTKVFGGQVVEPTTRSGSG